MKKQQPKNELKIAFVVSKVVRNKVQLQIVDKQTAAVRQ